MKLHECVESFRTIAHFEVMTSTVHLMYSSPAVIIHVGCIPADIRFCILFLLYTQTHRHL